MAQNIAPGANASSSVVPVDPTTPAPGSALVRATFELNGKSRSPMTLDASEKTLVGSMEAITTSELQDFMNKLDAVQGAEVMALLSSLFDFMGFDPIQIIKKLLAINKYYCTREGGDSETLEILKEDIMMMVAANIIMGNLQTKSVSRRSKNGRAALEYLVSKYQMKMGSTGAGLPSDTLTFPRVANSFPVLTCRSAMILPSKNLPRSPFTAKNVPKFMRVSSFATFCSEEMEERTQLFLLRCVCAYSCDYMITVHEGEKKKRKVKKGDDIFLPEDAWAAQWDYIYVSSNSPVPSIEMKRAMMVEFGVDELYETLKPVVDKVSELIQDKVVTSTKEEFERDIRAFTSGSKEGLLK